MAFWRPVWQTERCGAVRGEGEGAMTSACLIGEGATHTLHFVTVAPSDLREI